MEDAHATEPDLTTVNDDPIGYFAVFDGHGGTC
jgi:serine/threonine protein phosphatase PrpC